MLLTHFELPHALNCVDGCFLSSPLAGKRDIVVTILVRCMCVRSYIHAFVRPSGNFPDHNLYNYAWISKSFGTVVALDEE